MGSSKEILEVMEQATSLYKGKGVDASSIANAESALGVTFASDFRAFLSHFGFAMTNGHEILGLGEDPDMIEATETERTRGHDIDASWYVVEQTNIDGIVIWQDASGSIYQTAPGAKRLRLARSLSEFLTR